MDVKVHRSFVLIVGLMSRAIEEEALYHSVPDILHVTLSLINKQQVLESELVVLDCRLASQQICFFGHLEQLDVDLISMLRDLSSLEQLNPILVEGIPELSKMTY